jgi:peroxisomal 3,2-trans-enoyl-CoA isomerase
MPTTINLPRANSSKPIQTGNTLLTKRLGHKNSILLTSLNRPRVKNAFNDEQYTDLVNLLHTAKNDDSVHAIVLTGTGNYFSSGADLSDMDFESEADMIDKPAGKFMMALLAFPKVFVAAVNGPSVGIGVTLLMHCDLAYCTNKSTFWVPFTRIALVPEFCSSVTFIESSGLFRANELLLLGKKIDAKRAVQDRIVCDIIDGCDESGDAFAQDSIGSKVCKDLDERLFQICHGDKTSEIFVSMIRGRAKRREELEVICKDELKRLDERLRSGDVLEAAMQLDMSRSKM